MRRLNKIQWVMLSVLGVSLGACFTPTQTSDRQSEVYLVQDRTPSSEIQSKRRSSLPRSCGFPYRVKWGDTLSEIALDCGLNMRALAYANRISPPYPIFVGQKLKAPDKQDVAKVKTFKPVWQRSKLIWPTSKQLSYRFLDEPENRHLLKVFGSIGEPVYSVDQGVVVYTGKGLKSYGLMVMVRHHHDLMTVYAHNQRVLVKEGDQVKAGQQIATMGQSGGVSQPQLHLEVRYQGKKANIKRYLSPPEQQLVRNE